MSALGFHSAVQCSRASMVRGKHRGFRPLSGDFGVLLCLLFLFV